MSQPASDQTVSSDTSPMDGINRTAAKSTTLSPAEPTALADAPNSEGSLISFSESLFFPTASDAIWQSAAVIPGTLFPEDIFGHSEENDDESSVFSVGGTTYNQFDGETSEDDENITENLRQPNVNECKDTNESRPSSLSPAASALSNIPMVPPEHPELPLPKNGDQPLTAGDSTTKHKKVTRLSITTAYPLSPCQQDAGPGILATNRLLRGEEDSPQLVRLHQQLVHLTPPGVGASVKELEKKFESGLRLLDDLVHANVSDDDNLKYIYEAYYNFAQALFGDIQEPSRAKVSLKSGSQSFDMDWSCLERQKEEISEQEKLLEKEILHYKATKRELQKIAKQIEEASKSYRKPEILEDVVIPKDIKLSSSSEYVAEIEELQAEILKKQEALKEMHKEIQHRLLPRSLVDSVCESHRLAMQALRDIEEETVYLKQCVDRLDLKYLYNLQIS